MTRPRSLWNGTIAFGEVAIPVKLFAATEDHRIHFREVRLSDGCRIEHRLLGADSGRAIRRENTQRAYETSGGKQVILTDEEIAAARGSRPKVIELEHFVAVEQIDPVYYDKPYLVGTQDGGERGYRVLLAALERSGKVGIGRFVLRTREQLVALRPRGRALVLHTMRFADEVVDRRDLRVPPLRREPSAKEVEMAQRLVDTLATGWRAAKHRDRYTADVLALIRRKAKGEEIEAPEPEEREAPDDLSAALEASLSGRRRRRARGAQHRRRTAGRARSRGNGHGRRRAAR
ncbi:MAG TPA: Ku protein [Conexibacter sp.]|jgi:DNA end-binding protein Ku|nr:Ku protein [Conexibacter sp.]